MHSATCASRTNRFQPTLSRNLGGLSNFPGNTSVRFLNGRSFITVHDDQEVLSIEKCIVMAIQQLSLKASYKDVTLLVFPITEEKQWYYLYAFRINDTKKHIQLKLRSVELVQLQASQIFHEISTIILNQPIDESEVDSKCAIVAKLVAKKRNDSDIFYERMVQHNINCINSKVLPSNTEINEFFVLAHKSEIKLLIRPKFYWGIRKGENSEQIVECYSEESFLGEITLNTDALNHKLNSVCNKLLQNVYVFNSAHELLPQSKVREMVRYVLTAVKLDVLHEYLSEILYRFYKKKGYITHQIK